MPQSPSPSPAETIRDCLAAVDQLRHAPLSQGQRDSLVAVKSLQAERFAHTYRDFLADKRHAPATRFFLNELYGAGDFSLRDAQFGRIAGAVERLFPEAVAALAVNLAQTHALTEQLDHTLASHWHALPARLSRTERYLQAWRRTGQAASRQQQLSVVLQMGQELQRLTKVRSLRMALRVMRGPAGAAGLADLQQLLEEGFDAFAHMRDAQAFLSAIETREQAWLSTLFDADTASAMAALHQALTP